MGIDAVVCAITAIAGFIEHQTFLDEMSGLTPFAEGQIKIIQVPISNAAPAVNKKIREIRRPGQVIVACILRGDKNLIPSVDTVILAGDVLVIITSEQYETAAIQELTGKWKA